MISPVEVEVLATCSSSISIGEAAGCSCGGSRCCSSHRCRMRTSSAAMVSFVAACRSARALRSRRLSKPVDSTGSGVFRELWPALTCKH